VLANHCFRSASVGIRAGFSCSFPNVISHGRSTGNENHGFNRDHQQFNYGRQRYVRSDGGVDNDIKKTTTKETIRTGEENQSRLLGFIITTILLLLIENQNILVNLIWNTMNVDITTS